MRLSYCVVNTGKRELLLACLDAIERTAPPGVEHEVLVLDNASDDGSAEAVRGARTGDVRLIALERRDGQGGERLHAAAEARGRYCLLLNEDSELQPGAVRGAAGRARGRSRRRGGRRAAARPDGRPQACAWRLPGRGRGAGRGALFLHGR